MITRYIFPYVVREWVFFKIYPYFPNVSDQNVRLAFNPNVKLDLRKSDIGHKSIIFTGFSEIALSKYISRLAKTGGLMVDVGANYGYYSCLWAGAKPNNKVIAFEASPLNQTPLENNIKKNNFTEQIKVIPLALGKEKGKMQFSLGGDEEQTGWGGFTVNANDQLDVEVEVDTLDAFALANGIDNIDVLKIDTEGADTWVLFGAKNLLSEKKVKHIFFEHNIPRMELLGINRDEARNFLNEMGYEVQRYSGLEFYAHPRYP